VTSNISEQGFEPCQVKCYSGHTYAQCPEAILAWGETHRVTTVKREWREPGLKHFVALTEAGKEFQLCYDEQEDAWWLKEFDGGTPG